MSNHFKNRLVGVVVIVALGVLFLPDLLNGKKQRQEETFTEIPLKPALEQTQLPDKAFDIVDTNVETKIEQAVAPTAVIADKPQPSQVTQTKGKAAKASLSGSAWTLRLGSFKNAKNVIALVDRLRQKGFNAYTLPSKPVDGQITKVFVGPDVSKDKLTDQQSDIEKLTQLKGRIEPYNPVGS